MTTRKSLSGESRDNLLSERSNRRDVFKRGLAFGLGAPALAGALAAYGPDVDSAAAADSTIPTPGTGSVTPALGTIADLRGLVGAIGLTSVILQGRAAPADGGQGIFYWDPNATAADNGVTVIQPGDVANGRWLRWQPDGALEVDWFGARGDGEADDTPAITAALTAAKAGLGRGMVRFCSGKTYKTTGVTIDASDITILAHGSVLLHAGDNTPLVTIASPEGTGAAQRVRWYGGKLRAKPSGTNPTSALMYITRAWRFLIEGVEFAGADDDRNDAKRAAYGIYIRGTKLNSVYWGTVIQPHIHGCADAGLFIDGWDEAYSPVVGNYTGACTFLGSTIMQNARGIVINGTNFDQFYGGHVENNVGYGIQHGPYARDVGYWGIHLESNNGGTKNQQAIVDTSDPGSNGRSYFVGAVSAKPPPEQLRWWKFWIGTGSPAWGSNQEMHSTLVMTRESSLQIASQFGVDEETYPRMRMPAAGNIQYRDPASDTNSFYDALVNLGMNQVGTGATTVFRPRGGMRLGDGTLVTKHLSVAPALDFPSIPAASTAELTAKVNGAAPGDAVTVTPNGAPEPGLIWSGYVSAPDTVTVRLANTSAKPIDPAKRTWRIAVTKY